MKILVPTKGRAGKLFTQHIADKDDIIFFAQRNEKEEYLAKHPDLNFVFHDEEPGVANVRNVILDYAEKNGITKYVMSDDDIHWIGRLEDNFYKDFPGRKTTTKGYRKEVPAEEWMKKMEELLDDYAGVSFPMVEFARLGVDENELTKQNKTTIFAFFGLNTDKIRGLRYDPSMKIGEDHDFTLQILYSGQNVGCNYSYAYSGDHKVEGGCFEDWKKYSKEDLAKQLRSKWNEKDIIVPKPDNRYIRINFKNVLKHRHESNN